MVCITSANIFKELTSIGALLWPWKTGYRLFCFSSINSTTSWVCFFLHRSYKVGLKGEIESWCIIQLTNKLSPLSPVCCNTLSFALRNTTRKIRQIWGEVHSIIFSILLLTMIINILSVIKCNRLLFLFKCNYPPLRWRSGKRRTMFSRPLPVLISHKCSSPKQNKTQLLPPK